MPSSAVRGRGPSVDRRPARAPRTAGCRPGTGRVRRRARAGRRRARSSAASTVASAPERCTASGVRRASTGTSAPPVPRPGPARSTTPAFLAGRASRARSHCAADGTTPKARSASAGSSAHGTPCSRAVGTTMTGPSGSSRAASPSSTCSSRAPRSPGHVGPPAGAAAQQEPGRLGQRQRVRGRAGDVAAYPASVDDQDVQDPVDVDELDQGPVADLPDQVVDVEALGLLVGARELVVLGPHERVPAGPAPSRGPRSARPRPAPRLSRRVASRSAASDSSTGASPGVTGVCASAVLRQRSLHRSRARGSVGRVPQRQRGQLRAVAGRECPELGAAEQPAVVVERVQPSAARAQHAAAVLASSRSSAAREPAAGPHQVGARRPVRRGAGEQLGSLGVARPSVPPRSARRAPRPPARRRGRRPRPRPLRARRRRRSAPGAGRAPRPGEPGSRTRCRPGRGTRAARRPPARRRRSRSRPSRLGGRAPQLRRFARSTAAGPVRASAASATVDRLVDQTGREVGLAPHGGQVWRVGAEGVVLARHRVEHGRGRRAGHRGRRRSRRGSAAAQSASRSQAGRARGARRRARVCASASSTRPEPARGSPRLCSARASQTGRPRRGSPRAAADGRGAPPRGGR